MRVRRAESRERELLQGFRDGPVIRDVRNRKAELLVKDDGACPAIPLTDIGDVGRFVAAACEMPLGKREPTMSMFGESVKMNEVVGFLEKEIGVHFEVTEVNRGKCRRGQIVSREMGLRGSRSSRY